MKVIEKEDGHSKIDVELTICILLLILSLHRWSKFFLGVEGRNCKFFSNYCPWDNEKKSADCLTDILQIP